MSNLRFVKLSRSMSIPGQKPGASQLNNVEGSVGRDGITLPFVGKKPGYEEGVLFEALVPWSAVDFVVRERQDAPKK